MINDKSLQYLRCLPHITKRNYKALSKTDDKSSQYLRYLSHITKESYKAPLKCMTNSPSTWNDYHTWQRNFTKHDQSELQTIPVPEMLTHTLHMTEKIFGSFSRNFSKTQKVLYSQKTYKNPSEAKLESQKKSSLHHNQFTILPTLSTPLSGTEEAQEVQK